MPLHRISSNTFTYFHSRLLTTFDAGSRLSTKETVLLSDCAWRPLIRSSLLSQDIAFADFQEVIPGEMTQSLIVVLVRREQIQGS